MKEHRKFYKNYAFCFEISNFIFLTVNFVIPLVNFHIKVFLNSSQLFSTSICSSQFYRRSIFIVFVFNFVADVNLLFSFDVTEPLFPYDVSDLNHVFECQEI